jgi:hypothetical protein
MSLAGIVVGVWYCYVMWVLLCSGTHTSRCVSRCESVLCVFGCCRSPHTFETIVGFCVGGQGLEWCEGVFEQCYAVCVKV